MENGQLLSLELEKVMGDVEEIANDIRHSNKKLRAN